MLVAFHIIDLIPSPTIHATCFSSLEDQFGQTPEERATMTGHHTLASWFRQHYRLGSTRGGSGAAYHEAMQDERAVVKVEWHQIK